MTWTKTMQPWSGADVWELEENPDYNIERKGHVFEVWLTYDSFGGARRTKKIGAYASLPAAQRAVAARLEREAGTS